MAQLIIEIPDDKVSRIRSAFGIYLNKYDGDGNLILATTADIQNYIKSNIRDVVKNVEIQSAMRTTQENFIDVF